MKKKLLLLANQLIFVIDAVCDAEQDTENLSLSSISEDSEIPPPNYDDEWDKVSVVDKGKNCLLAYKFI